MRTPPECKWRSGLAGGHHRSCRQHRRLNRQPPALFDHHERQPNPEGKGSIGFKLDGNHTTDPELFDTAVRYPNQTLQASRAMFGPNSTHDAAALGIRRNPLTEASPFHQFRLRPPDSTPTFADRFGNWRSSENGVSVPAAEPQGLPALIADQIRRQNEQAAGGAPPPVVGGAQSVPFVPDGGEGSFADRFGDQPPIRRLSSWVRPR
jgi:hypothetical protein